MGKAHLPPHRVRRLSPLRKQRQKKAIVKGWAAGTARRRSIVVPTLQHKRRRRADPAARPNAAHHPGTHPAVPNATRASRHRAPYQIIVGERAARHGGTLAAAAAQFEIKGLPGGTTHKKHRCRRADRRRRGAATAKPTEGAKTTANAKSTVGAGVNAAAHLLPCPDSGEATYRTLHLCTSHIL